MGSKASGRKKSKKITPKPPPIAEPPVVLDNEILPPRERGQHDEIERARPNSYMPWGDNPPLRVTTQNPLDRYLVQGVISECQHSAGQKLYGEWRASGSDPRIVSSYMVRIEGRRDMTPFQADMKVRVDRALEAVGSGFAPILVHVCIIGHYALDWALARGMPRYKAEIVGIEYLKDALTLLWMHYEKRRG